MKRTISREKATKIATGYGTNETQGITKGDMETDIEYAERITENQFVGGLGGGEVSAETARINFAKEIKGQGAGQSLVGKKTAGGGTEMKISAKDSESI
jgi:hypothetical protein